MTIMRRATKLFNQEEIAAIEAAIRESETKTSAEVVPVVATVSGRYDRAEDLFGFLLALLALGAAWAGLQELVPSTGHWSSEPSLKLGLPLVLAILVVTFFIGIALASWLPFLRLPLIGRREMQEEVERSARETFQRLRVRRTEGATGVLIYVSLYEHMVHVVGDDAISTKLADEDWQAICDTIVSGFKGGKPAEGMRNGIVQCGKLLARHFPIEADDRNELPDTLHLLH